MLKYIDSQNIYGTMNKGSIRLTNISNADKKRILNRRLQNGILEDIENENLTDEERTNILIAHRKKFAKDNGFDWHKMFMADQKHKNGSYFEITQEFVHSNPNGWASIPEDILIISDKLPGIVAGHPVADCPVVIMEDKKNNVTAVCHCSADLVDKKMPIMIANALKEIADSKNENIKAYIGACIGNDWTYDSYPKWALNDEVWEECIIDENGIFKIDIKKAIKKQLDSLGLLEQEYSKIDTLKDPRYYSNCLGNKCPEKFGRHFIGAFYEKEKTK